MLQATPSGESSMRTQNALTELATCPYYAPVDEVSVQNIVLLHNVCIFIFSVYQRTYIRTYIYITSIGLINTYVHIYLLTRAVITPWGVMYISNSVM